MTEFKLGDLVLIPGSVIGLLVDEGVHCAVVRTRSDNDVLEEESNLRPDAKRPLDFVEALARVMCVADNVDPDSKASYGQPFLVGSGYVAANEMFEAWRLYAKYAQALIDKGLA